jgi:dTMP kinase
MVNKLDDILQNFSTLKTENSYFISFEGIEGSGKSTQIQSFKKKLEDDGYSVLVLREPGGTEFGEGLRNTILNSKNDVHPLAQTMLFTSARVQILSEKVLPFLEQNKSIVILDRYFDSTIAYQGFAGKLGMETVLSLHQFAPLNTLPHVTFYLKIDLQTSHDRQNARGNEKDYFESQNNQFYSTLIEGYDKAAETFTERIQVIDAKKNEEEVKNEIFKKWEEFLCKN